MTMNAKTTILIIFCLSLFIQIKANSDKLFGSNNKLSNSHVNYVYQDKKGFVWVCTENGLNVFNGLNFKTYHHRANDTTSLVNNSVLSVLEDRNGQFWVGTSEGVQLFNRDTECFSNIRLSYTNITDFSYIKCITEDSKGNIWLSTNRSGVIRIKESTNEPVYYMQTNSNICSNKINVIYEDRFSNIWIGSQDNGISVLNTENHTIVNYAHEPGNPNSLSSNKIFSIIEDPDGKVLIATIDGGIDAFDYSSRSLIRHYIPSAETVYTLKTDSKNNLWIGTDGLGLKYYDFKTKSIKTYESELINLDLRQAKVHSIFEDRQHNIWVALYQKGVLMIPLKDKIFNNIGFNPFYSNKNIGNDCILTIAEDQSKDIWVGTDGDGIYRLNANREVRQHYKGNSFPANVVLSIFEDSKKRIWVGTYLYGLFLYNPANNSFDKRDLICKGIDVKHVNAITEDQEGNLWIGTNENGVCKYNPDTKNSQFLTYDLMKNKGQLLSNSVNAIAVYKDKVWMGTSVAGLSCYNMKTDSFEDYTVENGKLSNNNIFALSTDRSGGIWVGTNWGLNYINPLSGKSIQYTESEGLPNAAISGIEIDKHQNIWISTFYGLSHYNAKTGQFTNYYTTDGLVNNEFRRGAYFQSDTGEIFFGGISGLTFFKPFETPPGYDLSNLVFTDLLIYNEVVTIGKGSDPILEKSIDASSEIKLKHNIKSFSIGFSALEYNNPNNVIYQAKLDGFENSWVTLPQGSNSVTYTNLKARKYTLHIRAFLPNTTPVERSIIITVTPPLWFSWWAKTIYAFILAIGIYYLYKSIALRSQKKKEDVQKAHENQIMQSKLQFFTDISHEIRTPLTLILTPIEELLKETTNEKLRSTYKIIDQNGHRILRLVNQVMEMRKLDKGQVKLLAEKTNIDAFIREIINSFTHLAQEKNITFTIEIQEDMPEVWIDQEKLDKVIFNVLSNAFKYTPQSGCITLTADTTGSDLRIRIADSGCGIPKNLRESVFERFYQIPDEINSSKMGTGIGLHLSHSLMKIHHGHIYVEDTENTGAVFVILLPLGKDYLQPDEMQSGHSTRNLATLVQTSLSSFTEEKEDKVISSAKNKYKPKILIVEDNREIKDYISSVLSQDYQILEAENGRDGLETAIRKQPSCIISDVMMPEMDGIEMCEKIKKNEKTSHIPVILLTAKTAIEQRVEGLRVGADSYIPKPFNIEHLKIRISKLIEVRRVMKEKYEGKSDINEEIANIKTTDEKFLEKLENIVKNQIGESELSVETISQEIGISRSQLQRKLKQLTNQNPSDYIKTMRLRHAALLLSTKNLSISEVTYATGFSSLSHFSNSFKEFYGMSPSRYMEINNNGDQE